jgi:EpsI family protein
MIARRDFLIAGACIAAAGAAYGLKPRHEVKLLPAKETLADLIPMELPGWTGLEVGDPLALNQEGTLSARLYNQLVTRLYRNTETNAQVMMLLAYGARQSDDLQLHRPEICYPAFGYTLVKNQPTQVPLADSASVPARRLVAENAEGREYVVYWSRLGEFLPQDGSQQREARFLNAFHGLVPDGVLCRFSTWANDEASAWTTANGFIAALVSNMRADRRSVLIGSQRAKLLTTVHRS